MKDIRELQRLIDQAEEKRADLEEQKEHLSLCENKDIGYLVGQISALEDWRDAVAEGEHEEKSSTLRRRINRLKDRLAGLEDRKEHLSQHGYWDLGYVTGRIGVLEEWLEEVLEYENLFQRKDVVSFSSVLDAAYVQADLLMENGQQCGKSGHTEEVERVHGGRF